MGECGGQCDCCIVSAGVDNFCQKIGDAQQLPVNDYTLGCIGYMYKSNIGGAKYSW